MSVPALRVAVLAGALAAAPVAAGAATLVASGVAIFGDSLSDPGNAYALSGGTVPPSPPYFQGRYSNGPIWADRLRERFAEEGRPVLNYAVGGSFATTGIPAQVGAFALTGRDRLGSRGTAVLFAGANDVIAIADGQRDGALGRHVAKFAAKGAARSLGVSARALADLGVEQFLVVNVPDLGATPLYELTRPDRADEATAASRVFNRALDRTVDRLRDDGLTVGEVDLFGLFRSAKADPAAFGLADATRPCLLGSVVTCTPEEASTRLFWDLLHPTRAGHALLAEEIGQHLVPAPAVAAVPLPAPLAMLLAGLGALGIVVRSGRRTAARTRATQQRGPARSCHRNVAMPQGRPYIEGSAATRRAPAGRLRTAWQGVRNRCSAPRVLTDQRKEMA